MNAAVIDAQGILEGRVISKRTGDVMSPKVKTN